MMPRKATSKRPATPSATTRTPKSKRAAKQPPFAPTSNKAENPLRRRFARIYRTLRKCYPDAHCALHHRNAFELMVSTILSAQCTDSRVNMVTPELFKRYPDAYTMAEAPLPKIEQLVRTTGFFRNKSKSLKGASQAIAKNHRGEVPDEMDQLLALPGIARKTANVILGNAFQKNEGVVVDTHVARLSQRLGLTQAKIPTKIELDLMTLCPRKDWTMLAHLLIFHGRQVCTARNPDCVQCRLVKNCPKVGVKG